MLNIWTIGYGRCREDEFMERLSTAFPDGDAVIVDVRKAHSESRNGRWAYWGDSCMGETCLQSGRQPGNRYVTFEQLRNRFGRTKRGLSRYEDALDSGNLRPWLDRLVKEIYDHAEAKYCLLCVERKPFTDMKGVYADFVHHCGLYGRANCHRVKIAQNVTARLHFDYKVKCKAIHLY
jgi:hypothetical protein